MFETIDVELASHLTRAQGLGLGKQLLEALDPAEDIGRRPASGFGAEAGGSAVQQPRNVAPLDGVIHHSEIPLARDSNRRAGKVTSAFRLAARSVHGAAKFHRGIDLRAAYGQDVPGCRRRAESSQREQKAATDRPS